MFASQKPRPNILLWIVAILFLSIVGLTWVNLPVSADYQLESGHSITLANPTRDPNGGGGGGGTPTRDPNGSPPLTPPPGPGSGKDCSNTSIGQLPLIDLANGNYQGFPGGLYTGSNEMPNAHFQEGLSASQEIEPLDEQGTADPQGKIVILSVGMSNAKQEFGAFFQLAREYTPREVALVNGAQGGYDAPTVTDPNSDYWQKIDQDLIRRNLTRQQVQIIWLKQAVADESDPFPQHAQELQGYLKEIVLDAETLFPNLKMIFFSSRIYGGYSGAASPSPESWAYEGGFAVQWLIESQINGSDNQLRYQNTPWLAWGPYLWADGLTPRSDGLIWECDDFEDDGAHPAETADLKVGQMLLDFFSTHPTTSAYFTP